MGKIVTGVGSHNSKTMTSPNDSNSSESPSGYFSDINSLTFSSENDSSSTLRETSGHSDSSSDSEISDLELRLEFLRYVDALWIAYALYA